jgi:hypothetical protein
MVEILQLSSANFRNDPRRMAWMIFMDCSVFETEKADLRNRHRMILLQSGVYWKGGDLLGCRD